MMGYLIGFEWTFYQMLVVQHARLEVFVTMRTAYAMLAGHMVIVSIASSEHMGALIALISGRVVFSFNVSSEVGSHCVHSLASYTLVLLACNFPHVFQDTIIDFA